MPDAALAPDRIAHGNEFIGMFLIEVWLHQSPLHPGENNLTELPDEDVKKFVVGDFAVKHLLQRWDD